MRTRLIEASKDVEQAVQDAAGLLFAGGLVAFPTETVYGLGALGLLPAALEKIFIAKGRPHDDPLILHVSDPAWLDDLASDVPESARLLVEKFWPGPLTLVLAKSPSVPDLATAGLPSVAVRMPAHPLARALIAKVGAPLAAPSANRFGHTSPTTAGHVLADLAGRIDAVLDAGPTEVGVESTVIDLRSWRRPLILRPGGVAREAIEEVLGQPVPVRAHGEEAPTGASVSPGLLNRHYSPRAVLRLFGGGGGALPGQMLEAITEAAGSRPGAIGVLAYEEDREALLGLPVKVEVLGPSNQPDQVARNLFFALRRLDDSTAEIFARLMSPEGLGEAVNDRLTRAAAGRIET